MKIIRGITITEDIKVGDYWSKEDLNSNSIGDYDDYIVINISENKTKLVVTFSGYYNGAPKILNVTRKRSLPLLSY